MSSVSVRCVKAGVWVRMGAGNLARLEPGETRTLPLTQKESARVRLDQTGVATLRNDLSRTVLIEYEDDGFQHSERLEKGKPKALREEGGYSILLPPRK